MPGDELRDRAVNLAHHDFYELLDISTVSQDTEIRRAYRKTALKYHPDKVGASDVAARETFDLLQIAYEILSDADARQLYDNARRAKEEEKNRRAGYDERRKELIDDLERRERAGAVGLKRQREESSEEAAFQQELKRLAADGARRRIERQDQLRREARELHERQQREVEALAQEQAPATPNHQGAGVEDNDRSVKLRYPTESGIDRDELTSRFSRFGNVDFVVLRTKKIKVEGKKHKKEYTTAIVVFQSIVGAHAAVTDFPEIASGDTTGKWTIFEEVNWLGGKEPDCIPKPKHLSPKPSFQTPMSSPSMDELTRIRLKNAQRRRDAERNDPGLRKVPSFGSFKGITPTENKTPSNSPGMDELTRAKLRNAERQRLIDELQREEEDEERANAAQATV